MTTYIGLSMILIPFIFIFWLMYEEFGVKKTFVVLPVATGVVAWIVSSVFVML